MILETIGWVLAAGLLGAAVWHAARIFLIKRMAESFELGMKLGRAAAFVGQEQIDQMLRDANIDPTMLPGRVL